MKKEMIMVLLAVLFIISCNTLPTNDGTPAVADESTFAKPSFELTGDMVTRGSAMTENERLKIYIPAGANDWGNSVEIVPKSADFTVTTRLNFMPKRYALQAGIMLYNPSAGDYNAIKLVRGFFMDNHIQLASPAEGVIDGGGSVRDNVTSNTVWLRLIKNGRHVAAYYSVDGEHYSFISIGTTNMKVERVLLFGSSWNENASGTAYFEEFSIDYENHTVWTP